jgi:hypothetical protein
LRSTEFGSIDKSGFLQADSRHLSHWDNVVGQSWRTDVPELLSLGLFAIDLAVPFPLNAQRMHRSLVSMPLRRQSAAASRARLDDLQARLKSRGMSFSYEFDPKQHDRFLETEQWEIVLGRGLDFLFVPIATA